MREYSSFAKIKTPFQFVFTETGAKNKGNMVVLFL